MANRRLLKKKISAICGELLAESVAVSLYGPGAHQESAQALFFTIVKMQDNFTRRVSHPEPGLPAKTYFRALHEEFYSQVGEVLDQINS